MWEIAKYQVRVIEGLPFSQIFSRETISLFLESSCEPAMMPAVFSLPMEYRRANFFEARSSGLVGLCRLRRAARWFTGGR